MLQGFVLAQHILGDTMVSFLALFRYRAGIHEASQNLAFFAGDYLDLSHLGEDFSFM